VVKKYGVALLLSDPGGYAKPALGLLATLAGAYNQSTRAETVLALLQKFVFRKLRPRLLFTSRRQRAARTVPSRAAIGKNQGGFM